MPKLTHLVIAFTSGFVIMAAAGQLLPQQNKAQHETTGPLATVSFSGPGWANITVTGDRYLLGNCGNWFSDSHQRRRLHVRLNAAQTQAVRRQTQAVGSPPVAFNHPTGDDPAHERMSATDKHGTVPSTSPAATKLNETVLTLARRYCAAP